MHWVFLRWQRQCHLRLAPAGHADTGPIRVAARRGALTASESPLRGEPPPSRHAAAARGPGRDGHGDEGKVSGRDKNV